ncbi:A/G-specific adenine DNA glycosylase-like [Planoprotostelium fungivorum]|uniref:Adenine DNA glycosylase n=1 Tax=Planoprotostelium fungivorum TaxID=1890364 RepID=A0A2P6NLY2_9EUKA|nr:A/G-specific adenine DNA glycosylase-like [Planoprotostelium fungivorum]
MPPTKRKVTRKKKELDEEIEDESLSEDAGASSSEESSPKPKRKKTSADKEELNLSPIHRHDESYHRFNLTETNFMRSSLLTWYDENKRDLPWRYDEVRNEPSFVRAKEDIMNRRAYAIWVSEIMLQQTRVQTVIEYFNKWIDKWPTVSDLASATSEEVNSMWSGLGYYRRAAFLHKGAQSVVEAGGIVPNTLEGLLKVPGIGRYTAGAVASICFGHVTPLVDGNVIRVLSRLRSIASDPKSKDAIKLHWELAEAIVDPVRPGTFNQALMELGATVCTPKSPKCTECPLKSICHAYQEIEDIGREKIPKDKTCRVCEDDDSVDSPTDAVTKYPTKVKKNKQREEAVAVSIVERKEGEESQYLLVQRPDKGLLASLWEFPQISIEEKEAEKIDGDFDSKLRDKIDRYVERNLGVQDLETISRRYLGTHVHLFSHIRQSMYIESRSVKTSTGDLPKRTKWLSEGELQGSAVSSSVRKCLELRKGKIKTTKAKKVDIEGLSGLTPFQRQRIMAESKSRKAAVELITTDAIRKEHLWDKTVVLKFDGLEGKSVDHFIELQVLIKAHDEIYGEQRWRTGVKVLNELRKYFNAEGNLYGVPTDLNHEKADLTNEYLKGGLPRTNVSPVLKSYIEHASSDDRVTSYVKNMHRMAGSEEDHERLKQLLIGCVQAAEMRNNIRSDARFRLFCSIVGIYIAYLFFSSVWPFKTGPANIGASLNVSPADKIHEIKTGVPHQIHQSWKDNDLPFKFKKWSESWRALNEGWRWTLWTNEDNLALCTEFFPWFLDTYRSMQGEIFRADLVRNMYLYLVYADLDQQALRPIHSLFSNTKENPAQYLNRQAGDISNTAVVAYIGLMDHVYDDNSMPNAWMASSPGHPFWLLPLIIASEMKKTDSPEETSGPTALYNSWVLYEKLTKKGPTEVWDYIIQKLGDKFPIRNTVPHATGIIKSQYVYPHSWGSEDLACSIGQPKYNPDQCLKNKEVVKKGSYCITYWSHSWTAKSSDDGRVGMLQEKE